MLKALLKFWPALLPILLFGVWYVFLRKKYKGSERLARWESNLWLWTLLLSLIILIISIGFMLYENGQSNKGTYVPARFKDGKLIPSQVIPEKKNAEDIKHVKEEKHTDGG